MFIIKLIETVDKCVQVGNCFSSQCHAIVFLLKHQDCVGKQQHLFHVADVVCGGGGAGVA